MATIRSFCSAATTSRDKVLLTMRIRALCLTGYYYLGPAVFWLVDFLAGANVRAGGI